MSTFLSCEEALDLMTEFAVIVYPVEESKGVLYLAFGSLEGNATVSESKGASLLSCGKRLNP